MTRRPAVTLMEVLIAMFIMAIGMLALLALFPVGAVSMAQALKDDRCAYASSMAENVAIVNNVRYGDTSVTAALNGSASGLVYVDPYYLLFPVPPLPPWLGGVGVIPRVAPTFVTNVANFFPPVTPHQLTDRWFSLPDDITFLTNGVPQLDPYLASTAVDRGRRYSYAYLLRQQPPAWSPFQNSMKAVQLYAVVYSGRPVNSLTTELTLPVIPPSIIPLSGSAGSNSISINPALILPGYSPPKRGGWILDTSPNPKVPGQINGYFYRVTNLADLGATTTIEVQQTLLADVTQITLMDYVAEVFDKGFGWQQ